jgi:hypothetical protein
MSGTGLTSELEDLAERANLHTNAQIEELFQKVFKREMTPGERRGFFIPDDGSTKSWPRPPQRHVP